MIDRTGSKKAANPATAATLDALAEAAAGLNQGLRTRAKSAARGSGSYLGASLRRPLMRVCNSGEVSGSGISQARHRQVLGGLPPGCSAKAMGCRHFGQR